MGDWVPRQKHDADFPDGVGSLDVPMDPMDEGISFPHENPHHTFCVLSQLS
jgi:hypothetical protein